MKLTPPNITPGDWHAEGENVLSSKGEEIATCPPVFIFGEERGNVKAIAALPDLLKALEALVLDPYLSQPLNDDRMNPARQALIKAGYTIAP